MDEIENRARGLLAAECEASGFRELAADLREEFELGGMPGAALRAIAAALEAAREDACVALVADIRFACGDNGKRMQPELVEFIRELAKDAERLDALEALVNDQPDKSLLLHHGIHIIRNGERRYAGLGLSNTNRTLRQAIDAARRNDEAAE